MEKEDKDNLKTEFDKWYREQKEMNPYMMRDWFIDKLSTALLEQERGIREKVGLLRQYEYENGEETNKYHNGIWNDAINKVLSILTTKHESS